MIHARTNQRAKLVATVAIVFVLALTVAGCGKQAGSTTATTVGAKVGLPVATSALSTIAPDAKLLVVQTTEAVTTTSAPVWSYLFGSPKTSKTYLVVVRQGKVEQVSEYGSAGLTAGDWTAVPNADAWKIDSVDAYEKARAAAGASGVAAYTMGFLTYVPPSVSNGTKPMAWYVSFDPATSGATTGTVIVDAKTGAIIAK